MTWRKMPHPNRNVFNLHLDWKCEDCGEEGTDEQLENNHCFSCKSTNVYSIETHHSEKNNQD